MKVIQVFAKLFSVDHQPAKQFDVVIEIFELANNAWQPLLTSKTLADGSLSEKISVVTSDTMAPTLRIVEAKSESPRILAQTAYITYASRTQVLTCDFGEIELLAEAAYKVANTQTQFAKDKSVLSGLARRPDVSTAVLLRAVSLATPSSLMNSKLALDNATDTSKIAAAAVAEVTQPSIITLDTYNAELIRFRSVESQLQSAISVKDRDLADQKILLTENQTKLTALQKEIAQVKASEAALVEKNAIFTQEEKRQAPIQTIASNIGMQIDNANKQLKNEARPYQIQNIALELTGSLSQDGQSIALSRLTDNTNAVASVQKLKMDLVSTNTSTPSDDITVPDVSGLTESMVKRLLKSIGLKTDTMTQSVGENSSTVVGQALSQSPKAGTKLAPNKSVIVVFASV